MYDRRRRCTERMSGSVREVQELADQILELLGVRIRNGELVI